MFHSAIDYLISDVFGLTGHLREALSFFLGDIILIFALLVIVTHLMGIINFYFPYQNVKAYIANKKLYGLQYLLASLLGAVTPFCSCSSIPLFIGFVKGGLPLGVTLSFLITSPLINEVAVALFLGIFGLKVTIIYVVSGILLGTIGGMIFERLGLEHLLTDWVKDMKDFKSVSGKEYRKLKDVLPSISKSAFRIIKGVWIYIFVGIGIGAAIHGYVPDGLLEEYIAKDNIFAVPLAVILAVPIYSNASGIIPVIQALVGKGVALGTALSFMMAVVGLSLPEAMLLKKVMTTKLLLIYFSLTTLFIIIIGYLFNYVVF